MNYSVESEQFVIGSILVQSDLIYETVLLPEDFYHPNHQTIFTHMLDLREKEISIDVLSLTSVMGSAVKEIGGIEYLTNMARSVPSTRNFDFNENTVKEKSLLRSGLNAVNELCTSGTENPSEFAAEMLTIAENMNRVKKGDGFQHIREKLMEHSDIMSEKLSNPKAGGIPTAGNDLDRITGKWQKQTLVIIAARPSVGKTAFMLNNARSAAEAGAMCGIISLEQPFTQLLDRMIAAECHIDGERIKNVQLTDEEWTKYTLGFTQLAGLPIYIDDRPGQTMQEIRASVRKLKKKADSEGRDLIIFIDYLQLIQGGKRFASKREEVGYISNTLKQTARENDCPVVSLSQLSRKVEDRQDKRPMLSDLREAGEIEQDADIVTFLYRDDYYNQETDKKNIIEIIVAKNREGPLGTAEMVNLRNYCKFVDYDRRH